MIYFNKLVVTFVFIFGLSAVANAIEVAGVKVEDNINLGGNSLVLNGAGVRYKAIFQVYVAGLYVSKKASNPEEILRQPGAKRVVVTFLRDIDNKEFSKQFIRGLEDNLEKSDRAKVLANMPRMGQLFNDFKNFKPGDSFSIDWLPGVGTVISVKGKPWGEPFKDPEFFNALLRIWLGPNPPTWQIKEALLGIGA